MGLQDNASFAVRHDGWTPERKTRFIDKLAVRGDVRLACRWAGMSPEAAYRLRRRDPLFARGWAAALVKAREFTEQLLAERAIDGIEEKVWYRGELIDTRRRFDVRLFLAHMARLDKLADEEAAGADAGRFDELLACIAGERPPAELESEEDLLPMARDLAGEEGAKLAEQAVYDAELDACGGKEPVPHDVEAFAAFGDACLLAAERGRAEGELRWDHWFADACDVVDTLCGRPDAPLREAIEAAAKAPARSFSRTPSMASTSAASTSALAHALATGSLFRLREDAAVSASQRHLAPSDASVIAKPNRRQRIANARRGT